MFMIAFGISLANAAFVWLSYMALEPYIRRRWPDLLISWARLSSGKFRDPLVGRDLLAGAMVGAILAGLNYLECALPYWTNVRGFTPLYALNLNSLGDPRQYAGVFVWSLQQCVVLALGQLALLFLVRFIVRRNWLAIGITGLVITASNLSSLNVFVDLPITAIQTVLLLFVLIRFGLLALVVTTLSNFLISLTPITLRLSDWYAGRSLFALLFVVGLALYGFRTALASRSVFGSLAVDD
jgi:hypothetical protein